MYFLNICYLIFSDNNRAVCICGYHCLSHTQIVKKKDGVKNHTIFFLIISLIKPYLTLACAAASLAIGTLKGEQLT